MTASSAFLHIATVTVSIVRPAVVASGKRAETGTTVYSGVMATPFMPVDAETLRRLELKSPYTVLETMVMGAYAIRNADIAKTAAGKEYAVKAVEAWPFRGENAIRLVIEESQ